MVSAIFFPPLSFSFFFTVPFSKFCQPFFSESAYTEKYMGLPLPSENFRGYQKSSLIEQIQYIEGKEYFLAHGMADRNVHIQNSMIIAKVLVNHNIPFEQHVSIPLFSVANFSVNFIAFLIHFFFQFYPDEDHFLTGVKVHLYESVTNFLNKCFAKFDPIVEDE